MDAPLLLSQPFLIMGLKLKGMHGRVLKCAYQSWSRLARGSQATLFSAGVLFTQNFYAQAVCIIGRWGGTSAPHAAAQAAFHVFGMELLVRLDLRATNAFFSAFFRLPDFYWRGFLASSLSSAQLIVFALLMFLVAPARIQLALMRHLLTNSAGAYLIRHYLGARAPPRATSPAQLCAGWGSRTAGDPLLQQYATAQSLFLQGIWTGAVCSRWQDLVHGRVTAVCGGRRLNTAAKLGHFKWYYFAAAGVSTPKGEAVEAKELEADDVIVSPLAR